MKWTLDGDDRLLTKNLLINLTYSLFHKTLPRSSIKVYWISVRFYEMGVICAINNGLTHKTLLRPLYGLVLL